MNSYKPSTRAELITRRTYCRPKEDGIFETWEEVIERVISHQKWIWERTKNDSLNPKELEELNELRELHLSRKATMSGRNLWLGGTDISKTRESSQFNCAFTKVETYYDVVDVFWLLLQGCGVGFKPIRGTLNGFFKPIKNIKIIRSIKEKGYRGREENIETIRDNTWIISIGDSAEAWAKSIGKLMAGKYDVDTLILDFSEIRAAGERLKGYGWISSGDEALVQAYKKIVEIMNKKAESLLSALDILEILNYLGTVLSSRRSAQICLLDIEDYEAESFAIFKKDAFICLDCGSWNLENGKCKDCGSSNNNSHRGQSNNSLVFNSKPSKDKLEHIFHLMQKAGGSEPGFINSESATKRAPWFSGVNPCAEILLSNKSFCVSADTLLITKANLIRIEEAVGKEIEIWNGSEWSKVIPEKTGNNQKLVRVSFGDGSFLDCTEYHRFSVKDRFGSEYKEVQAKDLLTTNKYLLHTEPFKIKYDSGEYKPLAYTYGVAYGDGYSNKLVLYGEKIHLPVEGKRQNSIFRQNPKVPQQTVDLPFNLDSFSIDDVFLWDRVSILQFIAGLADADGSETGTGGIRIYQGDEQCIRKLQLLLTKVGIRSSVNLMARAGEKSNFNRLKAMWYVQITECNDIPCNRLNTSNGHKATGKGKEQTIVSVQEIEGLHDSFCFNEIKKHMGVFNNTLTYQCNLVEIDIGKFIGDTKGLERALYIMARANYRQTLVNLSDGILQEAWHKNNEFLRLCGVGLTGIAQRPELVAYDYRKLERMATYAAYSMADELNLQRPKNITTVKPSGTLSKIMDTTEGVHKPLGKYMFNHVIFSKDDENLENIRNAGYYVFDHPTKSDSVLIRFPVKWETTKFDEVNGVEVNIESAVEQLNRYKLLQTNWTQQNTSVTISYDPSEIPGIINWLLNNWDNYVGVSFIYRNDPTKTAKDLGYSYLPQEVITKEIYDAYVSELLPISVIDSEKEIESQECSSGICPVK